MSWLTGQHKCHIQGMENVTGHEGIMEEKPPQRRQVPSEALVEDTVVRRLGLEKPAILGVFFGNEAECLECLAVQNNTVVLEDLIFLLADVLVEFPVWLVPMAQERKFQEPIQSCLVRISAMFQRSPNEIPFQS